MCCIMTFGALWSLSHYDVFRIMTFVALWCLSLMTFVALWPLSHYDLCRIMTFVIYDVCRIMMFVPLWRLFPIMTFVAYRVCRSILLIVIQHSSLLSHFRNNIHHCFIIIMMNSFRQRLCSYHPSVFTSSLLLSSG